ncbi:uncharacterized protein LOC129218471 [Uloborus diversus]|uniref:uncharacterized protein LOC129218471 n=1 Tax=Uloborus diversus TaxID=327109 RepID=UPI002408F366|nr:uncharacterized protein LOC129218471 [Uloborus diversus]
MSSESENRVHPPMGPPDCPWREMSPDSPIPEDVVYQNGKLSGEDAYIGRVFDGQCLYVGTALPSKNICFYLDKNLELKSSSSYEILTCAMGIPLYFSDLDFENRNNFPGGKDEDETLLIGRLVDESADNTYYGWVKKSTKCMYVPRESKIGPQKVDKDYEILIHRFADRLCICPPCPFPGGPQ